jgi:hypothetical protein
MSLKASVQYGDFKGTSAADSADTMDIGRLAKFGEGYTVCGVRFYSGENHANTPVQPPWVTVLAIKDSDLPGEWSSVSSSTKIYSRTVKFKNYEDFFHFFKRFSVVLLRKRFPADPDYTIVELDEEEEE